jgi:hypothetical protein
VRAARGESLLCRDFDILEEPHEWGGGVRGRRYVAIEIAICGV